MALFAFTYQASLLLPTIHTHAHTPKTFLKRTLLSMRVANMPRLSATKYNNGLLVCVAWNVDTGSPVTSRASPASSRPRGATGAVRDPLARPGATAGSRTARSTAGARTARSATATASPGAAGGDANAKNADVLANFFNSLLSNNPAGGNPGAPRASGSRADAAKELSKMQGRPE